MKETYNWKSLFAGAAIVVVGLVSCAIATFLSGVWNNVVISIGCSLIASGLVIVCHDFFVEKRSVSLLDEWHIRKIFSTRAEKNAESDSLMVESDSSNIPSTSSDFGIPMKS